MDPSVIHSMGHSSHGAFISRGIHPKGVSFQEDFILFFPMTLIPLGIDPIEIHHIRLSSHRLFIPKGIHSKFFISDCHSFKGIDPRAIYVRG